MNKFKFGTLLSYLLLAAIPLALIFISLFLGRYSLSPSEVFEALLSLLGFETQLDQRVLTLVLQVRLPRALAAALVGAALAAAGASFQIVFRNPLTDAGLLGVSNGAGFGAALAIILFGGGLIIYFSSFFFGLLAVFLAYSIAKSHKSVPTVMLILAGVIVSSIFSALLSIMKYVADPYSQLPSIVYWLMGSLASIGFAQFWAAVPMAVGMIILMLMRTRMDGLSMGDKEARALGINVKFERNIIIAASTLASTGAVCLSGTIGWIGLVIPHIARMITGSSASRLLPFSISFGASFLLIIDLIARNLSTTEIPIGILSSLIGAPFFIYLLKKTKGGGW